MDLKNIVEIAKKAADSYGAKITGTVCLEFEGKEWLFLTSRDDLPELLVSKRGRCIFTPPSGIYSTLPKYINISQYL